MDKQKLSRRKFLQLASLTAMGGLAAFTTSGPAKPEAMVGGVAPVQQKVKVTFTVPGGGSEDADFAPVFEALAKMYPDIDAVYASAGTGYTAEYNQKLLTQLAGGVAPDVFKTQMFNFGIFGSKGVYLPLDSYIAGQPAITQLDDFFTPHVEGCKIDGKMMALPNDGAPTAMWVNVDLFKAAGLELPNWDTTWDGLIDMGKKITKKEGNIFTQHGVGRAPWLATIWSNGGEVISQDGKKCLMDKPEVIEALTFMQDCVLKHQITPTSQSLSEMGEGDRFTTGKMGSVYGGRGNLGAYRSIEKFKFDAVPFVMSNKKKRVTQLAIGYTSIWKGSKVPDQAYKVCAFVASAEGQRLRISRGYAHPSRKSLVKQDWYQGYTCNTCNSKQVNTIFPEILLKNEARVWAPYPKEAEIIQVINTELDALWSGKKTAEQVGKDITTGVDKVLAS